MQLLSIFAENEMNSSRTRIFKFRVGNANDLDALFDNYLWFASLSDLNDPYEGYAQFSNAGVNDEFRLKFLTAVYKWHPKRHISPEDEAKEIMANHEKSTGVKFSDYVDEKAKEIIKGFYEEHKSECKILSFSLAKEGNEFPAPLNNMLMWGHYTNGFRGFCIEFDFHKLKQSLEDRNHVTLASSSVDYATDGELPVVKMKTFMQSTIDGSKDFSLEILKAFTKKEGSWHHENEVRLMSYLPGKLHYDPECINAIYISEMAPKWLMSSLISELALTRINTKAYVVKLHPQKYKFGFSRIDA